MYMLLKNSSLAGKRQSQTKWVRKTTSTALGAYFPRAVVQAVRCVCSPQAQLVTAQCCHTSVKATAKLTLEF